MITETVTKSNQMAMKGKKGREEEDVQIHYEV